MSLWRRTIFGALGARGNGIRKRIPFQDDQKDFLTPMEK